MNDLKKENIPENDAQDRTGTEQRNRIRRTYVLIGVVVLILAFVYILYTALAVKKVTVMYDIVLIAALLIFWVLTDIVAPVKAHDFDDRTPEQMSAYRKMAAMELFGFAGLYLFASSAGNAQSGSGSSGNLSLVGAVIFLLATMLKRQYRDIYLGIRKDEQKEAGDEEKPGAGAAEKPAEPMTAANRLERLNKLAAEAPEAEIDGGSDETGGGESTAENVSGRADEIETADQDRK